MMYNIKYIYSVIVLITYVTYLSARPQQLSLALVPPSQQGFVGQPQNNIINPSVSLNKLICK